MATPRENHLQEYILGMLEQLGEMARRDGQDKLAARIDEVVVAERSEAPVNTLPTKSP